MCEGQCAFGSHGGINLISMHRNKASRFKSFLHFCNFIVKVNYLFLKIEKYIYLVNQKSEIITTNIYIKYI